MSRAGRPLNLGRPLSLGRGGRPLSLAMGCAQACRGLQSRLLLIATATGLVNLIGVAVRTFLLNPRVGDHDSSATTEALTSAGESMTQLVSQ